MWKFTFEEARQFFLWQSMDDCAHSRTLTRMLAGVAALGWIVLLWMDLATGGRRVCCIPATVFTLPGGGSGGNGLQQCLLFLTGWILMTVAMMLPSMFPFVEHFRRLVARRGNWTSPVAILISGYMTVWFISGIIILAICTAASRIVAPFLKPWMLDGWLPGVLFLNAGLFQFLPLKKRCLDRCRQPRNPLTADWDDCRPCRGSYVLGFKYGVSCIGGCGFLMLLMFAAGAWHLPWMLILAIVMAIEKNASWGLRLARPIGALLVFVALLVFLSSARLSI